MDGCIIESLNIFMRIIATVLPRPQHFVLSRLSIRGCCNGTPCATVRVSDTSRLVGVTHSKHLVWVRVGETEIRLFADRLVWKFSWHGLLCSTDRLAVCLLYDVGH